MSEYQYYDFRALDRPLTARQQKELRAISTRAEITATSFTNFYTFGDFKGSPLAMIERYFDAFLYFANWGTHELMLRVPRASLPSATVLRTYLSTSVGATAWFRVAGGNIILGFRSEDETGDHDMWESEGDEAMTSILPARFDLRDGDHRLLYLGWLLQVQAGEIKADTPEPAFPPGLRKFTAGDIAFRDFMRVDGDLAVAAVREVRRRGRVKGRGITSGDIRAAATEWAEKTRKMRAACDARVLAREQKREAARRVAHLQRLAAHEVEAWQEVEDLVAEHNGSACAQAAAILRDLAEIARDADHARQFDQRLDALRHRHAAKGTFISRLASAGLRVRGNGPLFRAGGRGRPD